MIPCSRCGDQPASKGSRALSFPGMVLPTIATLRRIKAICVDSGAFGATSVAAEQRHAATRRRRRRRSPRILVARCRSGRAEAFDCSARRRHEFFAMRAVRRLLSAATLDAAASSYIFSASPVLRAQAGRSDGFLLVDPALRAAHASHPLPLLTESPINSNTAARERELVAEFCISVAANQKRASRRQHTQLLNIPALQRNRTAGRVEIFGSRRAR